jgi:WD40 repeat protein
VDTEQSAAESACTQLVCALPLFNSQNKHMSNEQERTFIVSAGDDCRVRVWDSLTGTLLTEMNEHTDGVLFVATDYLHNTIASCGRDNCVRLWDATSGSSIKIFEGHTQEIWGIAFSPNGNRIASCSSDHSVRVWDVETGLAVLVLRDLPGGAVYSIAYGSLEKVEYIVAGFYTGSVCMWNALSGEMIWTQLEHQGNVNCVAFSPTNTYVGSGGYDAKIMLWRASSGVLLRAFQVESERPTTVTSIAFGLLENAIVAGGSNGIIYLWNSYSTTMKDEIAVNPGTMILSLAINHDKQEIICGSCDDSISVFDMSSGNLVKKWIAHEDDINSVACLSSSIRHFQKPVPAAHPAVESIPHGELVVESTEYLPSAVLSASSTETVHWVASASYDGTVRVWDVDTGRELSLLCGHESSVACVDFSPNGINVASGGDDHMVRVWNVTSAQQLRILQGHSASVHSVKYDRSGKLLASGAWDYSVCLWEVNYGHCLWAAQEHNNLVQSLAFHPSSESVASGSWDGTVCVWGRKKGTRELLLELGSRDVTCVTYSPGGERIAAASSEGIVRIWDSQNGLCFHVLDDRYSWINTLSFSPCGQFIVCGSEHATVTMFDTRSGDIESVQQLNEIMESIALLGYSKDDRAVSIGRSNGTYISVLWRGLPRKLLLGHTDYVNSVAFYEGTTPISSEVEDSSTSEYADENKCDSTSDQCPSKHTPPTLLVASAGDDKIIRLWNGISGDEWKQLAGHTISVEAVAFNPLGSMLVSGGHDWSVRLWDVRSGKQTHLWYHTAFVKTVAFTYDGIFVLSAGADHCIRVWDLSLCAEVNTLGDHTDTVLSVAASPKALIVASGGMDRILRVTDIQSGKLLQRMAGHTDDIRAVAFVGDGRRVVSASDDGTVRVWDIYFGEQTTRLNLSESIIRCVATSPRHPKIACADADRVLRVCSYGTMQQEIEEENCKMKLTLNVSALCYSSCGTFLICSGRHGIVYVLNAETGEPIQEMDGHWGRVNCVACTMGTSRDLEREDEGEEAII